MQHIGASPDCERPIPLSRRKGDCTDRHPEEDGDRDLGNRPPGKTREVTLRQRRARGDLE